MTEVEESCHMIRKLRHTPSRSGPFKTCIYRRSGFFTVKVKFFYHTSVCLQKFPG